MLLPIFTLNFNEKLLVDRVALGINNTKEYKLNYAIK